MHHNRYDFALAKLSPDFNWVNEFGNSGAVVVKDTANNDVLRTAAILPNGKVLLAGSASPIYYITNRKLAKFFGRDTVAIDTITSPQDSLLLNKEGLTILPNPVQDEFNIYYSLSGKSIISINLYDNAGRPVYAFLDKAVKDAGMHSEKFAWPNDIVKGIYFVRLSGRTFAYAGKVLKN